MLRTIVFLFLGLLATKAYTKAFVVYGDDNRTDYYLEIDNFKKDLANSVATLVPRNALRKTVNGYFVSNILKLKDIEIERDKYLCHDENFAKQQVLGSCSGFLVDKNKMATAGHCYPPSQKEYYCNNYVWVFDFKISNSQQLSLTHFTEDQVYECQSVISSTYNGQVDFSVAELKRQVNDREVLQLQETPLAKEDSIFVIGYPYGLPLKITSDAKIFNLEKEYFSTNLDTFQGNSGSPVFNEKTGNVIGILVRGKEDYYEDKDNKCMRVNICDEKRASCKSDRLQIDGEHVNKIDRLKDVLKNI